MISAATVRLYQHICLTLFPVMAILSWLPSVSAQTSVPTLPATPNSQRQLAPTNPNVLRPVPQTNSLLSVAGGKRLMSDASNAVSSQNYSVATQKLQQAREVFNQMSNFYQQLASSFSGIDNRVADSQRQKALETAQMRDDATYQLALVHRTQNQPELAVPLLVQIISSQNPTRDLGKKAYQQLFELGFVDSPFPRSGRTSGTSQPANPTPSNNRPQPRSSTK